MDFKTLHRAEKVLLGCWIVYTIATLIGFIFIGVVAWHFLSKLW